MSPSALRRSFTKICALGLILTAPIDSLLAQTFRPQVGGLWSQAANWGGTLPANDGTAELIFSEAGIYPKGTSTLDGSWNVRSLTWNPAALSSGLVTLRKSGENMLTVQSGLSNLSGGRVELYPNLILGGAQTWNDTSLPSPGGTLVVFGTISGTGGIQKTGSGTLALWSAANSFTGGLSITGGAVQVPTSGALGAATGLITLNGGTLRLGTTSDESIAVTQPIFLGAAGGTVEANSGTTTLPGGISGNGPLRFEPHEGMGSFWQSRYALSGTNSYSGGTALGAVTVTVSGPGQALGTGAVTLKDGAVLALAAESNLGAGARVALQSGTVLVLNSSSIDPGHVIDANPAKTTGGTLAYGVDITTPLDMAAVGNGTLLLGAGGNVTYAATSLGAGTGGIYRLGGGSASTSAGAPLPKLTFAGTPNLFTGNRSVLIGSSLPAIHSEAGRGSTIVFREANNYSGGTTIAGALAVGHDAALGSGPLYIQSGSLSADNGDRRISNPLVFQQADGASFVFGATESSFLKTLTIDAPVDLGGTSHIFLGHAGSTKFLQPISNGSLNLVGGKWTLSAANTFAGGLTLSDYATAEISRDDQLGAAGQSVTFQRGILHAISALVITRPIVTTEYGTTFDVDQKLTIAGSVSGYQDITKKGPGTLIFTGGDQNLGSTDITAGTVLVNNGTSSGPLSVVIRSGATLGGNGHVGSVFLVRGGHLAPGTETPSLLNVGSLSILTGCFLDFDLGLNLFDQILVGAGFIQKQDSGTGAALINLSDAGGLAVGQSFTLIDWSAATSGPNFVPADFALGDGPIHGDLTIIDRTLQVTITAVPEPSSVGLFGLLALGIFRARRRG